MHDSQRDQLFLQLAARDVANIDPKGFIKLLVSLPVEVKLGDSSEVILEQLAATFLNDVKNVLDYERGELEKHNYVELKV